MADPSLNPTTSSFPLNSNFTSTNGHVEKDGDEVMVVEESILRSRKHFKCLTIVEEVSSKYEELIATLPKEDRWPTYHLLKYKGFWIPQVILPGVLAMQECFKPRPNDVIVTSYLKSGTTWLKALAFTIMHRSKYDFDHHPLLKFNSHDCVPIIEYQYGTEDEQYLETVPSPRVLGTHVSYSILPENIKTSNCKIIYIYRDPKDVLVSYWHMVRRIEWLKTAPFPFNDAFELFSDGIMPYGPVWDHVQQYYTWRLQNSQKILFLEYKEMKNDPIDGVIRIANFIGCPFSTEEVEKGLVEEIVEFCSFDRLKNLDVNKNDGIGNIQNDMFFRKAVVGDWKNHMTTEMATKLDEIIKENLQGSDFTY